MTWMTFLTLYLHFCTFNVLAIIIIIIIIIIYIWCAVIPCVFLLVIIIILGLNYSKSCLGGGFQVIQFSLFVWRLKLQDTFIPTHFFVVITMCSDTPSLPLDKNCSKLNPLAFILHNKEGIQTCQVRELQGQR